jgi:hypothetical protein
MTRALAAMVALIVTAISAQAQNAPPTDKMLSEQAREEHAYAIGFRLRFGGIPSWIMCTRSMPG